MMTYLERLKGLNSKKRAPRVLQKLQKANFSSSCSFCSREGGHFSKITDLSERPTRDLPGVTIASALSHEEAHHVERGVCPDEWTGTAVCVGCGVVRVPPQLDGADLPSCPWCDNRVKGRPRPRPFPQSNAPGVELYSAGCRPISWQGLDERSPGRMVSEEPCGQCRRFTPDSINPAGGLGICGVGAEPLVRPWTLACCGQFRAKP